MKFFNLKRELRDYYGQGNSATFFFLGRHRYSGGVLDTVDVCSAALFSFEDAHKTAKELSQNGEGEYTVEECPDSVKHNLRSCFV